VLHGVVCDLLRKTILVLLHELLNGDHTGLLTLEIGFQLISLGKLVLHLVLHLGDTIGDLLHLLIDTTFQVFDLFKITLTLFNLYSELGSR